MFKTRYKVKSLASTFIFHMPIFLPSTQILPMYSVSFVFLRKFCKKQAVANIYSYFLTFYTKDNIQGLLLCTLTLSILVQREPHHSRVQLHSILLQGASICSETQFSVCFPNSEINGFESQPRNSKRVSEVPHARFLEILRWI